MTLRTRLLLAFQGEEPWWQLKIFARARYCMYFIAIIYTYCTVRLRNPKNVVRRGFASRFGIRSRELRIPKQGFLAFFGFLNGLLLWITFRRVPTLRCEPVQQHLQACGQGAAAEQWVCGNLLERVDADALHRFARMRQCLAHQTEVVRVELHSFKGCQWLIVQHIHITLDAPGAGISPPPHQTEPTRQPQ